MTKLSKDERQRITDYIISKTTYDDSDGRLDGMLEALDDPVGKADIAYRHKRDCDKDYKPKKVTLEISNWELGALLKALRYTYHDTSTNVDMYDAYVDIVNKLRGEEK